MVVSNANTIGGYTADYFDYGISARAFGLGGAVRSVIENSSAGYWNSATLPGIIDFNFSYMSMTLLGETNYNYIGTTIPFGNDSAVGINYIGLSMTDLELHNKSAQPNSTPDGSFNVLKNAIMLSYGKKIGDNLNVGVTGKYGLRKVYTSEDSVFTFDFGMLLDFDFLKMGSVLRNIYAITLGDETDDVYDFDVDFGLSLDLNTLLLSLDVARILRGQDLYYAAGLEYTLFRLSRSFELNLRTGINKDGLSMGFGINFLPVVFDYAYIIRDFNNEHIFSTSIQFDDNKQKQQVTIGEYWYKKALKSLEKMDIVHAKKYIDIGISECAQLLKLRKIKYRIALIEPYLQAKYFENIKGNDLRIYQDTLYHYLVDDYDKALENSEYLIQDRKHKHLIALRFNIENSSKVFYKFRNKHVIPNLFETAMAELLVDNLEASTKTLEKILYLEPKNITALKRIGSNYYALKLEAKATLMWQKVLDINPNDSEVLEMFNKLKQNNSKKNQSRPDDLIPTIKEKN